MPFKNCAQERALWVKNPLLAKKWTEKYGSVCKDHPIKKTAQNHIKKGK